MEERKWEWAGKFSQWNYRPRVAHMNCSAVSGAGMSAVKERYLHEDK